MSSIEIKLRIRWAILFAIAIVAVALVSAPAALAAAPTVTGLNPGNGPAAGGNSVTISGSGFTGATGVQFGSQAATSVNVVDDSTITATAPAGPPGTTVDVTVSNGVETSDTAGGANDYTYDFSAPTVTSLSPNHGPAAGGNQVTISGTNLIGTTSVHFGPNNATNVNVVDANTVTATAPGNSGGNTVNVTVTTAGGTSSGSGSANDYFYDVPSITALTPNHGPGGGGYQVTITGSEFSGASSVKFGSANATALNVLSDSTITVNAPGGAAGSTVNVTVVTPNGTSGISGTANDFSYDPVLPPTITALSPARGPSTGGNQVTLTGTGFAGATSVKFGVVKAAFLVLNNGTITATAPPGTGVVDVTVTTAVGTNPASGAGNDYSYDPVLLAAGPRTPNTFIGRHPHHRIHKRKVAFSFSSDVSGVSFQCLYANGWNKCHSPLTFRHLTPGRYRFKVRAVVNRVTDPTPATFIFRVRR